MPKMPSCYMCLARERFWYVIGWSIFFVGDHADFLFDIGTPVYLDEIVPGIHFRGRFQLKGGTRGVCEAELRA